MKDVMIDLETMSLRPDAAILSIGAVIFEPNTRMILGEFEQNVELASCVELGLHVDDNTTAWWAKQDRDLRDALTKNCVPIHKALVTFTDWLMLGVIDRGDLVPWSNGAGFDIPILETAYARCNMQPPWTYKNISCYRTLRRLYKSVRTEFKGAKHNALDDARNQAIHLMEVMAVMARQGDVR